MNGSPLGENTIPKMASFDGGQAIDWTGPDAGPAAWRTFERLSHAWQLTLSEKLSLLGVPRATWYRWEPGRAVELLDEVRVRLSYLLGIYAALHHVLPVPARSHEWLRKPNRAPLFAGDTALARMCRGGIDDLAAVRAYLDAQLPGKS